MKSRTILATLAVLVVGAAGGFAADMNMGTWKLNEGKSKLASGGVKKSWKGSPACWTLEARESWASCSKKGSAERG